MKSKLHLRVTIISVTLNILLIIVIFICLLIIQRQVIDYRGDVAHVSILTHRLLEHRHEFGNWPDPGEVADSTYFNFQSSSDTHEGRVDRYALSSGETLEILLTPEGKITANIEQ